MKGTKLLVGDKELTAAQVKSLGTAVLYVVDLPSHYSLATSCSPQVRELVLNMQTSEELEELQKVYFETNPSLSLSPSLFPDAYMGASQLKYTYITLKQHVTLPSGSFSAHYLIQLDQASEQMLDSLALCKWGSCMVHASLAKRTRTKRRRRTTRQRSASALVPRTGRTTRSWTPPSRCRWMCART